MHWSIVDWENGRSTAWKQQPKRFYVLDDQSEMRRKGNIQVTLGI
jgi:hypothetical protein